MLPLSPTWIQPCTDSATGGDGRLETEAASLCMSSSESLRFERPPFIHTRRSSYAFVNEPSSVGVFAKSLHLVALGWIVSLGYLWLSLRQTFVLDLRTILLAIVPLLFVEGLAWSTTRWSEWTPGRLQYEAEWRRAFWWSLLPNLLLLAALLLTA